MSKSSCGALEHLPVQQFENFHEFRDSIKLNSGELVATCDPLAAEKAGITVKSLNEWKPKKTVGIVLGDEGVGISKEILNFCDTVISIAPTREHQSSVTSLNVSVVAGIPHVPILMLFTKQIYSRHSTSPHFATQPYRLKQRFGDGSPLGYSVSRLHTCSLSDIFSRHVYYIFE